MLPLALFLAVQVQSEVKTWYGPETATFPFAFAGNPFDSITCDIKVQFIDGKGKKLERVAYFDSASMAWKAVLVADKPGKYRPVMFRNGIEVDALPEPEIVELDSKPIATGFVRIDPVNKTRFRTDDGNPFLPLGFNLGWQGAGLPDMTEMIKTMGQNGVNWTRIWASAWDGKNPWVPQQGPADEDRMLPDAFVRWDELVHAAEEAGVVFQFVLFHHGLFSTKTDSNWADHPWNKAKGGFLEKPADFFTDPEANRRTKMWLRYAVARWGHSPSVMAWELFNEVEWVDARYEERWSDVLAWHREMADYVRSIDPYAHMVTTSSTRALPGLFESMDFYQPHIYSADVRAGLSEFKLPIDKPTFFGEVGAKPLDKKDQRMVVRDGIWTALLSGHSGAAGYWPWEVVHKEGLYGEYKVAAKILQETGFGEHLGAKPSRIAIDKGTVMVQAIRLSNWLMARITANSGEAMKGPTLSALGLAAGKYQVTIYNLDSGTSTTRQVDLKGIDHKEVVSSLGNDLIVVFATLNS